MGNNNILKSCFSIEFLKKINNESQRSLEHLQEVVQKLENRIYTHGLNVKRLKSKPSWAIWQAKLNDSRRLLFTFHRHLEWDSNNQNTYIHFWTIIDKKQDDVNNWLKRKTNSSKWFNSEEIWSEKKEVDNIPDNPAIDLTEVDKHSVKNSWDSYFNLDNRFDIPVVDPPDSLPWFTNNDGNIQNLLEKNDYYYNELLLTKEQVGFVSNELPMLVNGSAGSGKTTLAIYKMKSIYESYKESNIVYISYNNSLVKHAKSLFKTLIPDFSTERISFYKFNDYYKEYLNKNSFDKHIITWNDVIKLFEQQGMTFNKAWNVTAEIRSVIKGKLTDLNSAYLDKDTYIQLPSKHTFFKNDDRLEVYKHFEYYCGYLKENNFIDDQDLANIILKSGKIETPYDIIVIDEVQDLTEKQIAILIDSVKDSKGKGVYITGDENQTIHPTSFSWSNIKNYYHNKGWNSPEVNRLTKNFRSSKQITEFSNTFLDIAKDLDLSPKSFDGNEISEIEGTLPEIINNPHDIIEYFKSPNPFNAIITSTKKQMIDIKKEVGHSFVWTIQEAKGLGFNLVLLYKPETEIHDKNIFSDFNSSSQNNFILQQLRSLYVGSSRARKDLIIFPANRKNPIWNDNRVNKSTKKKTDKSTSNINLPKNKVTFGDWEKQGKYYFEKGQYDQASECFNHSAREDLVNFVYWIVTDKRDGENQIVENLIYPIDKWLIEYFIDNISFWSNPELLISICENQALDINAKKSHLKLNLSQKQIEYCNKYVIDTGYSYIDRVTKSIDSVTHPSKRDIVQPIKAPEIVNKSKRKKKTNKKIELPKKLKSKEYDINLKDAELNIRRKKYFEALKMVLEILDSEPFNNTALEYAGRIYYLTKQFHNSIYAYLKIMVDMLYNYKDNKKPSSNRFNKSNQWIIKQIQHNPKLKSVLQHLFKSVEKQHQTLFHKMKYFARILFYLNFKSNKKSYYDDFMYEKSFLIAVKTLEKYGKLIHKMNIVDINVNMNDFIKLEYIKAMSDTNHPINIFENQSVGKTPEKKITKLEITSPEYFNDQNSIKLWQKYADQEFKNNKKKIIDLIKTVEITHYSDDYEQLDVLIKGIRACYDSIIDNIRRYYKIPGFKEGKAPLRLIKKHIRIHSYQSFYEMIIRIYITQIWVNTIKKKDLLISYNGNILEIEGNNLNIIINNISPRKKDSFRIQLK